LILVVVNLDFENTQVGMIDLPLSELGLAGDRPIRLTDLVDGETFAWQASGNYVKLEPGVRVAHIFRVEQ
jgi:starch synthase (maltosyl-transferring)